MRVHKAIKQKIDKHSQDFVLKNVNGLNLPNSLLIIPDGNGRWAKSLGLSVYEGHQKGALVFAKILDNFLKLDIKVLGAWGFSEDNWKRPQDEIEKVMEVIEATIRQNLEKLKKNNVRFIVLGKKEKVAKEFPGLWKTLEETIKQTAESNGKTLVLFLDYGERFALEEFAKERVKDSKSSTYELLSKINKGVPLFDMVLRTSGEQRLSGFGPLASLAEFVSVKKNLPELTDIDIINALREFSKRERRLGGR